MTLLLHVEREPGPGTCPACGAAVVWVSDEMFRWIPLDPSARIDGAYIAGTEVDGFGDVGDPPVRARKATATDPPGPRWRFHVCS